MWEAGWTVEKIADAWNETLETVSQVLDQLSVDELPPRCVATGDLSTKGLVHARRNRIRHLYHKQEWSLEQLGQAYPVYSRATLERIVSRSDQPETPARRANIMRLPCRRNAQQRSVVRRSVGGIITETKNGFCNARKC
jgi:hypothetical protein